MSEEAEMSFLEHLEVLRWHLVRSVIAVGSVTIAAFFAKSLIFDGVVLRLSKSDFVTYRFFCDASHKFGMGDKLCFGDLAFSLININMSGQFMTHILVSIVCGIVVSFPYLLFEVWRFVQPALTSNERTSARGVVFAGSMLFSIGILFGYFVIAPLSVQFLGNYRVSELIQNQISLNSYITTVATIILACGLIFQLPLMVYFLTKMGVLTPEFMKTYRKHAVVVTLILSAIITPPDISSQILVSIPILFLYEISIFISRMVVKRMDET
ncbi:MAG: twin-arginine translocase subunit TatC [Vicingaceae bacterium]